MNPLLQAVISKWGWRTAYGVQGLVGFVMAFPCVMFLIYKTPEERGCTAYGADSAKHRKERSLPLAYDKTRRNRFWCCIVFTAISSFCAAYAQHLSNFASSISLAGSMGAAMVSASMVGNILAKALLGEGSDKWGNRVVCGISLGLPLCGFLVLAFSGNNTTSLLAGALLVGVCHANLTIMAPLLVVDAVAPEEYDHAISKTTTFNMLTSAFSTMLIGLFYEITGSYMKVFLFGGLLQIVSMGIVMHLYSTNKNCKN